MTNFQNFELSATQTSKVVGGKGKPNFVKGKGKPDFASIGTPELVSFVEEVADIALAQVGELPEGVALPDLSNYLPIIADLLPNTGKQ